MDREAKMKSMSQDNTKFLNLNSSKVMEMDSSATFNVPKKSENSFPAKNRRTNSSFSSLSSLSSSSNSSFRSSYLSDESPLISPPTKLQFSGVPFSWEKLPGIPKKQTPKKKDPTRSNLLPLPPPATPPTSKRFTFEEIGMRKKNSNDSFRRDPFFAAFVECCKDEEDTVSNFLKGTKVARNLSDKIGFVNLYTSCKRTCAVSESIIYVPRPSRSSDDLWNRRSS